MALILLHSPKGGVGTTTLSAGLVSWLARGGRPVLAIDFSPYESLGLHLRRDMIARDPAPQAPGPVGDGDAPQARAFAPQVRLVSRAESFTTEELLHEVDRALATEGDARPLVVCDIPAGETLLVERLAGRALIQLCVLAADAASATMLPVLLNRVAVAPDAPRIHYVLNRLDERRPVSREVFRLLREAVGDDLVAAIRADEAVNEALAALSNVYDFAPTSAAAADIAGLADRVAASVEVQRAPQRDVAA